MFKAGRTALVKAQQLVITDHLSSIHYDNMGTEILTVVKDVLELFTAIKSAAHSAKVAMPSCNNTLQVKDLPKESVTSNMHSSVNGKNSVQKVLLLQENLWFSGFSIQNSLRKEV